MNSANNTTARNEELTKFYESEELQRQFAIENDFDEDECRIHLCWIRLEVELQKYMTDDENNELASANFIQVLKDLANKYELLLPSQDDPDWGR